MEIKFLGHSSFEIKGREAVVVTDPFDPKKVGFDFPKVEADIVTVSHDHSDHNYIKGVGGDPFIISGPGEYEVQGVRVFGIPAFHDQKKGAERGKIALYLIEMDGLSLVHLGDLGHKLEHDQAEELNSVDVLMIPVGGTYTINAETAAEVVAQLEPSIVIPMHYQTKDLELGEKLDGVEKFLEQMGEENVRREKKLKIASETSLPDDTEVVVLERTK